MFDGYDSDEDHEMEAVDLALLQIYMGRLTLEDDENMVDTDFVLIPFVAVNAMSDEPIHDAKNATWAFMPNASKNSTFRSSVIKIYCYKK